MSPLQIIVLIVLAVLVFQGFGKSFGRGLLMTVGCGFFLLMFLSLTYKRVELKAVEQRLSDTETVADNFHQPLSAKNNASTEEMWEHLNRSRIVLDAEGKQKARKRNHAFLAVASASESPKRTEKIDLTDSESEETTTVTKRPDWVDNPPKRIGNVYREVISSAAYSTVEECHQALEYRLREVVNNRIQQLAPNGYTPSLESLGLSVDFVLREICHEEWIETTQASFGEMKKVHVLMEFDAAVDKNLRQAFLRYHRSDRIAMVGSVALAVIALVMLVYGLFKADTWSRGYYTKRLFFGVPAVIIGLVFLLSNVNF